MRPPPPKGHIDDDRDEVKELEQALVWTMVCNTPYLLRKSSLHSQMDWKYRQAVRRLARGMSVPFGASLGMVGMVGWTRLGK